MTPPPVGTQGWLDLTVDDASGLRDFYSAVLGWKTVEIPMNDGAYADYAMKAGDDTVGGICHARGDNTGLPVAWLPYFVVASLPEALAAATERGATVVNVREKMAVLRDPAGAAFALWQG